MRITDPMTVRALAHPLRLDLLEALITLGPSTAARCGRHLGVSQASCSFHLRQLAKYGFVEEAAGGQDRRERVWQLTDVEQSWRSGPATDQLDRVFAQREADRVLGQALSRASSEGIDQTVMVAMFLGLDQARRAIAAQRKYLSDIPPLSRAAE